MADEISNRTLAVLLIVAIAISLGGTLVSLNRISIVRGPGITGLAASEAGTATVNITSQASLIFTTATIAFGNGWVNSSEGLFCMMSAENASDGTVTNECEGWSAGVGGLVLENNGNVNLSVDIQVNATGTDFVGSGGILQIMVGEAEANSCGDAGSYLNASVDNTWFTITAVEKDLDTGVCEELRASDTDTLYVSIRVNISATSDMTGRGTTTAVITAEGTTV